MIGGDCGGTSTRVVVTTLDGAVVGRGRGGPGNPVARPPAETAAALVGAVRDALVGLDPAGVVGAVVGVAGYSRLDHAVGRGGLRVGLGDHRRAGAAAHGRRRGRRPTPRAATTRRPGRC